MSTTPTTSPRTLRRRLDDRVIAGVCSGLADYFAVDPILVRLVFVAVTFAGGAGVLAYIILWIVMPPAPHGELAARPAGTGVTSQGGFWLGAFLVVLGILFLLGNTGAFWWWNWSFFWPLALIALGLLIVSRRVGGR
ncbi:MAG TPA: PspC domain-containing protein [Candidatus Limnocylindrales bacterium]|nr:PspC domain-containing protein [Candidatus Limnocylindrales bacterium]